MALTIIDLPDSVAKFTEITWSMETTHGRNASPFTGQGYAIRGNLERWRFVAKFKPLNRADMQAMQGFFLRMEGNLHHFRMGDPSQSAPLGVATGTPVLDGDHAARARTLSLTGCTPSTTDWLKEGDWLQIGDQLTKVVEDVDTDGSGNATVGIWPYLWEGYDDGAAVEVAAPKGVFHFDEGPPSWTAGVRDNLRRRFSYVLGGVQTIPEPEVVEAVTVPEEFDVETALYYAVAPTGYTYTAEQDTLYGARKYNTLSAAEAALEASPSTPQIINCIGDWTTDGADTTAVNFSGVATTVNNYILVRGIGEARHSGVWDASKYRLYVANATALIHTVSHIRFDGLLIGKSSSSAHSQPCILSHTISAGSDIRISNCVLRQAGNDLYSEQGVYLNDADCNAKIWNTIVYGLGDSTQVSNAPLFIYAGTAYVYSCTLIGGHYGIHRGLSGTVIAKNCYASANSTAYEAAVTKTTCASHDTSGSTGLHNIAPDTGTFINVTAGSENYHRAFVSPLIDEGTDTSGDAAPLNFTTDIDGHARTAPWSVGADE